MNLAHKWARLKHVSVRNLPRLAGIKTRHWTYSLTERLLYTPEGPRFPKRVRPLRPVGVLVPNETSPDKEKILERAKKALSLDVSRLWHADPKAGHEWAPDIFYADVPLFTGNGADVKVPWELSRCLHLAALAQAYALTRDETYARGFVSHVESWIRSNPAKFGVNWACPMDVALRACNWLAAWDVFHSSLSATDPFKALFSASLWEHGNHIFRHLEWGADVSTNHYLSDLLGLFYIGLALDERKWVDLAQAEFSRELFRQTYDDGFDYEGSMGYHRLALEIFFYYALVCRRHPDRTRPLGGVFLERLELMFDVVNRLSAPDGTVAMVGDNDSGRVHVFFEREDNDMSYLSGLGAAFLNRPSLKINEWGTVSELAWVLGPEVANAHAALTGISAKDIPSKGPSQSGLLTLRGPNDFLVFCAAPNGTRGVGAHTHNDKLSFCLWVKGEWFLIDPGTGVYTADPALRNRLRSTRAHNTVMVGGAEQNRIDPGALFSLRGDASVRNIEWDRNGRLEAAHDGYRRLPELVVHRRTIERQADPLAWRVTDRFEGDGPLKLRWSFHLFPGTIAEIDGERAAIKGKIGVLHFRMPSGFTGVLLEDAFSPAYGVRVPAPVVVFETASKAPASFVFQLDYVTMRES